MIKYIRLIVFSFISLSLLSGCKDDWLFDGDGSDLNGEEPVKFEILLPQSGTRGFIDGDNVKKQFNAGDIIHILGTFNIEYLNEDGSTSTGTVSRYGALSYVNSRGGYWQPVSGSTLTWPSVAVNGTFHAYYISQSNGVLTDKTPEETFSLSSITPNSDPLEAYSIPGIAYGNAVKLDFSHLCAYLSLENLQPMVASEYWFYPEVEKDSLEMNTVPFNNAFKIMLGQENNQPTLGFEFCQLPDDNFKNPSTQSAPFVYISAPQVVQDVFDANGNETQVARASFFLEPAFYEKFSLCYPSLAPDTYSYLTYDYNNIPQNVGGMEVENVKPNLKANTTYTLSVTKSPGVTIVTPPQAGGWDDEGQYFDVNVEEFLTAIYNKDEYINDTGTKILERTPNGSKLLHNVSFKYFNYSGFTNPDFVPNIQNDAVFDGDHHYIKELASPLFRYNYGTIANLGIQDIKITATSYESLFQESTRDMSRYGALCMWNRDQATISNVRIANLTMNISVDYRNEDEDGSETHNIGAVLGSNTGTVDGVAVGGSFVLNVKGSNDAVDASVLIGGIAGQNAATGSIYDVSPYESNFSLTINNSCKGAFGSYSIGGVAGESSGTITGVVLSRVMIDGSSSEGVTSYMGGIGGQFTVSENKSAAVSSCIISGEVKSGITQPSGDITSKSYLGGLAGSDLSVPVNDCRSSVSIIGSSQAYPGVLYGTGGAFGRIHTSSEYNFENIIAYGSVLSAPSNQGVTGTTNYIGSFAGIAPVGMTESDFSNKNIIVHSFTGVSFIGATLSEIAD